MVRNHFRGSRARDLHVHTPDPESTRNRLRRARCPQGNGSSSLSRGRHQSQGARVDFAHPSQYHHLSRSEFSRIVKCRYAFCNRRIILIDVAAVTHSSRSRIAASTANARSAVTHAATNPRNTTPNPPPPHPTGSPPIP